MRKPPKSLRGILKGSSNLAKRILRKQWIEDARAQGASWSEIAKQLEITTTGARKAARPDENPSKPGSKPGTYVWKGVSYIGLAAVASASKCSLPTVVGHLTRHGNLDRLGAGNGRAWKASSHTKRCRPVVVAGRSWVSEAAFARTLGVSPTTAGRWLKSGETEKIYAALMAASAAKRAA